MRLLIIDASPLRRACMTVALETSRLKVVSQPGLTAIDPRDLPDIILFQTGDSDQEAAMLPGQIGEAARLWPDRPVLVIADHGNEQLMLSAIAAGAQGLLRSTLSVARVQHALSLIEGGLAIYPAMLAPHIQQRSAAPGDGLQEMQKRIGLAVDRVAPLTRRQRDVLRLLAQGASNKDIATSLRISESTVKVHVRAIMTLKGASNRTQIVAHLLDPDQRDL